MKYFISVLLLGLSTSCFAQVPSDSILALRKSYAPLIDSLKRVVTDKPGNTEAHLALANTYYDTELWREAEHEYEIVLEEDPKNVNVRVDYAHTLTETNGLKKAIAEIKKALEYDPDHVNGNYNLGLYLLRNNLDDPKKAAKEALPYYMKALVQATIQHDSQTAEAAASMIVKLEKSK